MATWSRREVHTRHVEFVVPAPPPWGATSVEVEKAVHAATAELQEAGQVGACGIPGEDAVRIRPGDDEVIVSYETTETEET